MGYDRISALPDCLITQILLWLPTRYSIKTSVLSTRWRNLWLDVPGLELHSNDLDCFSKVATNNFGNSFLKFNSQTRLQKFKINYDECNSLVFPSQIREWIVTAVDHRGIQHLDAEDQNAKFYFCFLPVNIYNSKTLVSLKLQHVVVPQNPELVFSLPCLKILHLKKVHYGIGGRLFSEKLISGCQVLEELNLVRYQYSSVETLRVRSQTLKIFCLAFITGEIDTKDSVEIDAPRLKYMSFSDRIMVNNLNSLLKIDIDTDFNLNHPLVSEVVNKGDLIYEFLEGIASVTHMIISHPTLEILYHYSQVGQFPQFCNLSHLQASFSTSSLPLLSVFLESCSNLKSLILDFSVSTEPEQKMDLTKVPQCLISTLERVEINKLNMWEGPGMRLATYFIMNSAVLKKLDLNDSHLTKQEIDFYNGLFILVRSSRKCQVCFDDVPLIMLGRI
ncbi:putative F-box/FBD/LRR-repeat protein At5g44950 [Raphanus sativus]|uniref:F-box/FBD/LRR-repeat protein At5g44950 n=1 Tax=Raphanus sativus TaxID=3726 RepID=A0A9W3CDS3_RAPSA|nr:putative F-box/FBD/LRR-repeat protein At5g44950 [Raphanus sativus]